MYSFHNHVSIDESTFGLKVEFNTSVTIMKSQSSGAKIVLFFQIKDVDTSGHFFLTGQKTTNILLRSNLTVYIHNCIAICRQTVGKGS